MMLSKTLICTKVIPIGCGQKARKLAGYNLLVYSDGLIIKRNLRHEYE